jgi:hypothetical protein
MKHAVGMGSGVMIYKPNFMKTGWGIQKLVGEGGVYSDTHSMDITWAYFRFQIKKKKEVG